MLQLDLLAYRPDQKEMTVEQSLIHEIIKSHHGKESAISAAEIVALTGIGDRKMRDIVKTLVEDHGIPIGSCPAGFFIAVTEKEILGVFRTYLSWAFSLLKRASAFKRNSHLDEILGQLRLELEGSVS